MANMMHEKINAFVPSFVTIGYIIILLDEAPVLSFYHTTIGDNTFCTAYGNLLNVFNCLKLHSNVFLMLVF